MRGFGRGGFADSSGRTLSSLSPVACCLRRALRDYFAGDVAKIEAVRDGEVVELEITFDKQPEEEEERLDVHGRRRDGPFGIGLGGQRSNAQDQQGPDGHQYGGIFKSEDKGSTWTRINSLNPRPMYYSEIRVAPSDESYIYVLGTRLHKSSDGGKTFSSTGHGGDVHVAHNAMWVDPSDGRHILLGNDGGLYVTYDRMENWNHHNRMALGQFYNVTAGPRPAGQRLLGRPLAHVGHRRDERGLVPGRRRGRLPLHRRSEQPGPRLLREPERRHGSTRLLHR